MANFSNPSSVPIQAQNSLLNTEKPRGGMPFSSDCVLPIPIIDQVQFMSSTSNSSSSETFSSKEESTPPAAVATAADAAVIVVDTQPDSSENGGVSKKPVWNKPSNSAAMEVGAVMGADSWPALSELARGSPKSSSTDSLKAFVKEPANVSQVTTIGSQKEVTTGASIPTPIPNHVGLTSQRSMRRGGGSSSHNNTVSNGNLSQAPNMQGIALEASPLSPKKSGASIGESSRDNTHRDAGQRRGFYSGNEQQPHRNSFRRSNNGPQHNRRDQEREKQDFHRNFGNRESHGYHQRAGARPFVHGPSQNAPFIPSSVPLRPFAPPMLYPEMQGPLIYMPGIHQNSFRPVPMAAFSPMHFPIMPDPHLQNMILNQIDYYFSNENLVKDTFLRKKMDAEGWVPIKFIAGFKRVTQLTDNIQLILDSILASNIVEVQGDKIRRKGDWTKWLLPPDPQSLTRSSPDMLAAHLNTVTLDEQASA
ncbi:hypothetical protein ACJIZ3_002408 [Penstemon smallii]|uniref:HTH La-type RNA-binding domain-containing protein n=1 Tax=Penstemon smallii TaxID=265156 RepID=A0ABD3U9A6_9LAMI